MHFFLLHVSQILSEFSDIFALFLATNVRTKVLTAPKNPLLESLLFTVYCWYQTLHQLVSHFCAREDLAMRGLNKNCIGAWQHTFNPRTLWLLDWPGPEGGVIENGTVLRIWKYQCLHYNFLCIGAFSNIGGRMWSTFTLNKKPWQKATVFPRN